MKIAMFWALFSAIILSPELSTTLADSEIPMGKEAVGIETVLDVISDINIRQVDLKTNQTISDLAEARSQLYQPVLRLAQQDVSPLAHEPSPRIIGTHH